MAAFLHLALVHMTPSEAIAAVESRAFALRLTVGQLCAAARVRQDVWSRAKSRGTIRPRLLAKMEATLDSLERTRESGAPSDQAAA
jgi:hypothetical protein